MNDAHFTDEDSMLLGPRESARFISNLAKDVHINQNGLMTLSRKLFDAFSKNEYSVKQWTQHTLNPKSKDDAAINWVLFADTLNFSFWSESDETKLRVTFHDVVYTGYWALCACMNRALENGEDLLNPYIYKDMTEARLSEILRQDNNCAPVPLMAERAENLRQVGHVLVQKYNANFANCVRQCSMSAMTLLNEIVHNFPCFRDEALFHDRKVSFYKRAQILVADVWGACEGEGLGEMSDIDKLTAFADYRVPQVLAYFNVLEYSPQLLDLLQKQHMFKSGDRMEVEIRGCMLHAVELITEKMREMVRSQRDDECSVSPRMMLLNDVLVDFYLWDYRRIHTLDIDSVPYHRIRCIFY